MWAGVFTHTRWVSVIALHMQSSCSPPTTAGSSSADVDEPIHPCRAVDRNVVHRQPCFALWPLGGMTANKVTSKSVSHYPAGAVCCSVYSLKYPTSREQRRAKISVLLLLSHRTLAVCQTSLFADMRSVRESHTSIQLTFFSPGKCRNVYLKTFPIEVSSAAITDTNQTLLAHMMEKASLNHTADIKFIKLPASMKNSAQFKDPSASWHRPFDTSHTAYAGPL